MGKLIEFILLLPARLITAIILAGFVISFGIVRFTGLAPLAYDIWYDEIKGKLIQQLGA